MAPAAAQFPTSSNGSFPTSTNGSFPTDPMVMMPLVSAACQTTMKQALLPMFVDPTCSVSAVFNGNQTSAAELNTDLPQLCSASCIKKATDGFNMAMASPCQQSDTMFQQLSTIPYYYINLYCIKDDKGGYCMANQAADLDKANVPYNASISQWPKDTVCSPCTQKAVAFTDNPKLNLAPLANMTTRTNPAADKSALVATCGNTWVNNALSTPFTPSVQLASPSAGSGSSSSSGGSASGSGSSSSGASHIQATLYTAAGVVAVALMLM
ncbi:hypothetical protein RI367_002887 [Sorochytrium milnesiophthora]